MKKLLWILSATLLVGTFANPRSARADGGPPPNCPLTNPMCQTK